MGASLAQFEMQHQQGHRWCMRCNLTLGTGLARDLVPCLWIKASVSLAGRQANPPIHQQGNLLADASGCPGSRYCSRSLPQLSNLRAKWTSCPRGRQVRHLPPSKGTGLSPAPAVRELTRYPMVPIPPTRPVPSVRLHLMHQRCPCWCRFPHATHAFITA